MTKWLKILIGKFLLYFKSFADNCIYAIYRNKYQIVKSFRFNGKDILFYGEGEIICGENSYIGEYSTVQAVKGYRVLIGKGCQISHNVRIYTQTNLADQDFSISSPISKSANVVISDYVWFAANVFINPGIKIGTNSIIGANSVITKDVPSNAIFGGVPAKLIKHKSIG